MASRGNVSRNGHVTTKEYSQVGEMLYDAKILKGNNGLHSLPDYSHSPNAKYIKLDNNGNFREMRIYDDKGRPKLEIAYHAEETITGNRTEKVLHIHQYDDKLNRYGKRELTKEDPIYIEYSKYLEEFGL